MKSKAVCWIFLLSLHLHLPHPAPVVEAVQVVDEEHGKAYDHGHIGGVGQAGQDPQNDQDPVVCRVPDGVGGAAQNRQ